MDVNVRCKKHCNTACMLMDQSLDLVVQAEKRLKVCILANRCWVHIYSLLSDELPWELCPFIWW